MKLKAWHVPLRLATGLYILNAGLGKRSIDERQAAGLQEQAEHAIPRVEELEPTTFAELLSTGEIALGAALLIPFVPSWLVGAGLIAFSSGLLRMYAKTPELHREGSLRPSPKGLGIAKDIWMAGIGAALVIDAVTDRS
jgi:hypothetical protein